MVTSTESAAEGSAWVRSFSCEELRPLIVCRGPVRKEAMDVFSGMGITRFGILLSEKDSIVYPRALAPELRSLTDSERVHRVPDYTGASREERVERIDQIIRIALENGYDSIFAGYGFMAEDEEFVAAIEGARLLFIGPKSSVQARAGKKDEAKRTALAVGVSVTPGVDDLSARTLLATCPDRAALRACAEKHGLPLEAAVFAEGGIALPELSEMLLQASYARGLDLCSIEELGEQARVEVAALFHAHPGSRVRIKAIGGGGGKGQRILGASLLGPSRQEASLPGAGRPDAAAIALAAAEAPAALREALSEVKATGVGDNKNVLLELNVERTRHNEIQLIGNGSWCLALGGRDCSLQMHEQKLLEVSVTREGLAAAIADARAAGREVEASVLEADLAVLERMESDAERFGQAVGLDSVSTFECIVDGEKHYFMEVNTRIQVEHRVTELCYALRFTNPGDAADSFTVESLVEAMTLLARHGSRLPKPARIPRFGAAVEARLNATDASLAPHAGGTIRYWSKPIAGEIRDDQGIGMFNPDTGHFMRYYVAGAYDSNIALLLTAGEGRKASFAALAEVLISTTIDGPGLATNLGFHIGLVHWFLGRNVWAKPTTRFVLPYLAIVGALKEEGALVDPYHAWDLLKARYVRKIETDMPGNQHAGKTMSQVFDRKQTLVLRPMERLLFDPHLLSGWLSMNTKNFRFEGGKVVWIRNPLGVLSETYIFLHMAARPHKPAADLIWSHDHELLSEALSFYRSLREHFGLEREEYDRLELILAREEVQGDYSETEWDAIRSAHYGYEAGLEALSMLFLVGQRVGFWDLRVGEDLEIAIPDRLADPAVQARMRRALAPPPLARVNEIVAAVGGMYYGQEAPGLPPFVTEGMHFDKGQSLYIIEAMKMFNKIPAPFSGTIDSILMKGGDGSVVHKGQILFAITPDEVRLPEDESLVASGRKARTAEYVQAVVREGWG